MSWKRLDKLATVQHRRRGLSPAIEAGIICKNAESLYPEMFNAVSYRNGVLHIEVRHEQLLDFKMIEGKLIATLNLEKLIVERIRLTVRTE